LFKKNATNELPLDYPVKDMDSWLKIKYKYEFDESRITDNDIAKAKRLQEDGYLINALLMGGFFTPRDLMGDETACLMYYEDPELMHDIVNTFADTAYKVYEKASSQIVIDHITVPEDLAGKSGPLIGPNIVREFIAPYYKKVWDLLSSRGTKLFSQDSDGYIAPVMDEFIKAGVNVFYPMEPGAGMDMVLARKKYGKCIAFKGGIDKHILRKSKEEIRKELEYKLQPEMLCGRVIFGLDHRIPNGTPLENYRYYVRTAREILGLEPIEKTEKAFKKMAF